jgi:hypothetical protein
MLVLDRSSAMKRTVGDSGISRWAHVQRGIEQALRRSVTKAHWGLKLFPTTESCQLEAGAEVVAGPQTYQPLTDRLRAAQPALDAAAAPLAQAVQIAADALAGNQSPSPGFLVLVTAAEVGCSAATAAGDLARSTLAQASSRGFHSFVLSTAVAGTAEAQLAHDLAAAGRRPMTGESNHFAVEDELGIALALENIADDLSSCVRQLPMRVAAPDFVAVELIGSRVPRDLRHQQGWDWGGDHGTIQLYGGFCEQLKISPSDSLQAIVGCPGVAP